MKSSAIFQSWFNIKLTNKKIENVFKDDMLEKGSKYTNYLTIINTLFLIISIAASIIFANKTSVDSTYHKFQGLFWILIMLLILLIITTVLKCVFKKNKSIKKWAILLNYFLFSSIFVTLRYIIYYSSMTNEFIHVVFYIDFLLKFIWLEVSLIDFWENFTINFILIIVSKLIQTFLFGWVEQAIIYVLVADVLRASSIIFAYFILRKKRSITYYYYTQKETMEWYKSVLDNINSGFIKVINKRITFMNQCAWDNSVRSGCVTEPEQNEECNKLMSENQYKILSDIASSTFFIDSKQLSNVINVQTELSNISSNEDGNVVITNTLTHLNNTNNNSNVDYNRFISFLEKIKNLLTNKEINNKEEQFSYLGHTILTYDKGDNENHIHFELYGRTYVNADGDNIEMIFNDVTRTKIEQEKNAEIRYKTTLLSKIAHEFKNPLICLTEIIEEENDKASIKNFKMITAITNYLLILIKDIDTFSEIQFGKFKERNLSLSKIILSDVIEFINMIATYLIHKNHFEHKLLFKIVTNDIPSHITSDEIKLKQILINLISNSIKFTNQGTITLTIERDNDINITDSNYVKFTVTDTGIGIPLEKQPELFKVFSKAKLNNGNINKYGAGLGLTITNEMSKILGKQIQFVSKPNEGSSFWFSVNDLSSKSPKKFLNDSSATLKISEIALTASPILFNSSTLSSSINRTLNIIIADDELLIRNSMKRSIIEYSKKRGINMNIIEASDGIEVIYYVYEGGVNKKGQPIDFIISDENMMFYSGKLTAKKLKKLEAKFNIQHIPFYLSSAYSYQCIKENGIVVDGVFHKPLIQKDLQEIFSNFKFGEENNEDD